MLKPLTARTWQVTDGDRVNKKNGLSKRGLKKKKKF